ncbi:MAG: YbgA family protein [Actinoallomurus sp.]
MRPRIGISGGLLTEETRFNGERHRFITEALGAHVDWVPYTVEVETGLGALWESWRLTGQSHLAEHGYPGMSALSVPAGLDGYLTKAEPPGPFGIPAYTLAGPALFAQRLTAAFPLLPVVDDAMLDAAASRALFVERVFAAARLRELFGARWRPPDLVAFHTRHKLQILAHDPDRYRKAGRVVAQAGSRPRAETEADYRRLFGEALASATTRGRNANAMQHAFGRISRRLDHSLRHRMLDQIEAYQRGELPLGSPIVLLTSHAVNEGLRWTAEQTYLNPFPPDLRRHLWTLDASAPLAQA